MAILPYKISLVAMKPAEFQAVDEWCNKTWPYTHGATWYKGWPMDCLRVTQGRAVSRYSCTWSFQREEDSKMFQLAWQDMIPKC